jgi:hypothetical protein
MKSLVISFSQRSVIKIYFIQGLESQDSVFLRWIPLFLFESEFIKSLEHKVNKCYRIFPFNIIIGKAKLCTTFESIKFSYKT